MVLSYNWSHFFENLHLLIISYWTFSNLMHCIPLYKEINELHQLTGSSLRTKKPLFHCFDMAKTNDLKVNHIEPHSADFFTLALNLGTEDLSYSLNENTFENPKSFILCVAPGK